MGACGMLPLATGATIQADIPRHKVSGGIRMQPGRFELDLWVHWVSRTVTEAVGPNEDGYVLLDPRVGYRVGPCVLWVQAFNALDDEHIETANVRGIPGETIGRAVTFGVRYSR